MTRAYSLVAVIILCALAAAQSTIQDQEPGRVGPAPGETTMCGSSSTAVVLPQGYDAPTQPPTIGEYYAGQFGCRALRVANGVHEYSSINPFSANDTYLVAFRCISRIRRDTTCPGEFTQVTIYNTADGSFKCSLGELGSSNEIRWDLTDDDKFWYHSGNQILWGKVGKGNENCPRGKVHHTIRGYSDARFGGGQGDISDDGNHFFVTQNKGGLIGKGALYTISTKTLGPEISGGKFVPGVSTKVGYVMSNNDLYVPAIYRAKGDNGADYFFGATGAFSHCIWCKGYHSSHGDTGKDANGPIMIANTANDVGETHPPPCTATNSLIKINLLTRARSCLLAGNSTTGGHYSINNEGGRHYTALWSISSDLLTADPLPANWQQRWQPYTNELVLVALDGSWVRRLIHHRSRRTSLYHNNPRAALSRSGRYVLYTSNFGQGKGDGAWSIYLIKLW